MDMEHSSLLLKTILARGGLNSFKPSLINVGLLFVVVVAACHKAMTYLVVYPLFRLVFGTLYPAYASYKAVNTKNVKEYLKWMMYWIVFALFTCLETFTDVFLSWFPFYYEIKIILVIWLLSPATKGSSFLYRKFVHPLLSSREQEIDEYISKAKEQSYKQVLDLGTKGMSALMQTAIKGGGGLVNQLKKSYSLGDLSDTTLNEDRDQADVVITDPRLRRRRVSPHRSSSTSAAHIYFSEVDVRSDKLTLIQSAEDISSGYSSGEGLYASTQMPKIQARESLHRTGSLTRSRTGRTTRSTTVPKKTNNAASDESDDNEVYETNIIFLNDKVKAIDRLTEEKNESSSEGEFVDSVDIMHGNKVDNNEHVGQLTACSDVKSESSLTTEDCSACVKNNTTSKHACVEQNIAQVRGGRYNKKAAPPPPNPIKATLVLTPGVVKNVGESCKEVFMHSPKLKRRSVSNASNSKVKLNPLTKLMRLPKKIGFWHKGMGQRSFSDSKMQSTSCNSLPTVNSGSQLSIKSLTESPLAHRRLIVLRRRMECED